MEIYHFHFGGQTQGNDYGMALLGGIYLLELNEFM